MELLNIVALQAKYPELCRPVRVTVTQEHIDKGIPGDSRRCPFALAIQGKGYGLPANGLPEEARQFLRDFDAGRPVGPITFDAVGWLGGMSAVDRRAI